MPPFVLRVSYFFKSLLDTLVKKERLVISLLILFTMHIIYIIYLSFFLALFFVIIMTIIQNIDYLSNGSFLFWSTAFIGFSLFAVYSLNFTSLRFNLPNFILNLYFLSREIKFGTQFMKMSIWILVMTYVGYIILKNMLINIFPNDEFTLTLLVGGFLCLIILLYSEATVDKVKKAARKFNLWLLVFIVLCALTGYTTYLQVKGSSLEEGIFIVSGLLVGVIYNFSLVLENANKLYEVIVHGKHEGFMKRKKKWIDKHRSWSYDSVCNFCKNKKIECIDLYRDFKNLSNNEKKKRNAILFFFIPLMGLSFLVISYMELNYSSKIGDILDSIFSLVVNGFTLLLRGNESHAVIFLILIGVLYYFYERTFFFIKNYKMLGISQRLSYIQDSGLLALGISVLIALLLDRFNQFYLQYFLLPLSFLLLIIFPAIIWLRKKINGM